MRDANVKLNPKKCSFFKQRVEYLGHVVTPEGISPNPDKVRVVQEFPTPTNLKELRSFLGLANYYRRFVRGFSNIANPLNALTKKNVPFVWTVACAKAFAKLKHALVSAPILAYPNFWEPFLLFVDAGSTGIGFTLAQIQNGKEAVIAYNGRGWQGRKTADLLPFSREFVLSADHLTTNQVVYKKRAKFEAKYIVNHD